MTANPMGIGAGLAPIDMGDGKINAGRVVPVAVVRRCTRPGFNTTGILGVGCFRFADPEAGHSDGMFRLLIGL